MNIFFKPLRWLTFFSLIVFITLLGFGTWQIKRLFWKEALIDRYILQSQSNPIKLPFELNNAKIEEFKSIVIQGSFLHKN